MNTTTKIILGGVVMLLVGLTVLQVSNKNAEPSKETVSIPSSTITVPTQMIDAIPTESLEPPSVFSRGNPAPLVHFNTSNSDPISPELKRVTNDPAAAAFLNKYDPKKQELGEVRDTPNQTQQLLVNGKVLFEASQILRRRTMARSGSVVLAAIIDSSSGLTDKADTTTKPSTIWMIEPSGIKRQISPPNVNASTPLISPDGKRIAFTGITVGTDGSEEEPLLWVYDMTSNQYRKFAPSQKGHNHSVGAAEWSEDGQVLYVLEDYGETGGHMVMRAVKL